LSIEWRGLAGTLFRASRFGKREKNRIRTPLPRRIEPSMRRRVIHKICGKVCESFVKNLAQSMQLRTRRTIRLKRKHISKR
jgi:hypothetical protein